MVKVKRAPAAARKSRNDWLEAALEVLASDGIEGVRIDALAERLGVTKGSFYWHFRDRDELVNGAIARWEQHATSDIHALLDQLPSPRARLRRLVALSLRGSAGNRLLRELSEQRNPRVRAAVDRVTRARVAYVAGLYEQLGMGKAEARLHALLAYTSYLGQLSLPDDLRGGPAYARWLTRLLTAR
jgi:AcrR family transcriptional regulator